MKKILFALLIAASLAPAAQAQNMTSNNGAASSPALSQELGLGTTLNDGYTRVKYGANNLYKKLGAYGLYEFKGATSTKAKYSVFLVGANYFFNPHWGAFAGLGSENR